MKKFYLSLLAILLIPVSVKATTASISIKCPAVANAGTVISCPISVSSSGGVNGINGYYSFSSGITYQNLVLSSSTSFNVNQTSARGFVLGNTSGFAPNFAIGNLQVKLPSNVASGTVLSIGLINLGASDMDYNDIPVANASSNVRIASNNNYLSNLTVSPGNISFSKDITTYHFTVDAPSITINATVADNKSSVTGTGVKSLNYGNNIFNVVVTSESGTKRVYTLNVTRKQPPNTTPENNGGSDNNNKGQNQNTSTEDNDSKKPMDSNTNLSSLTIAGHDLEFSKDKLQYNLSVDNATSTITIEGKAESATSRVEGLGEKGLIVGENKFTIVVISENNSKKEYVITVIRDKKVDVTSKNKVKNIIIAGHKIDFSSDVYTYIVLTNEEKLDIDVKLSNPNASYEIVGNDNLKDGSIIKINITDEDGNVNVYTLNIKSKNEEKSNSNLLLISLAVFTLGLVMFIFSIIRSKKAKLIINK